MSEKNETKLNNYEWEKLKKITDELINYLDFNNSLIESDSQLKQRYNKVVDMYNYAVENKDQEMVESVKDKLIVILKDSIRMHRFYEKSEYEFDCVLKDDF